jgi:glyoxylase-like metal-dependent hydrolase (beta-lactamase superfamily II)
MILEALSLGAIETNCYILARADNCQAVIIDPAAQVHLIEKVLARHNLTPGIVINTHGHIDHIAADSHFKVPVYIHAQDAPLLKDAKRNLSSFLALPFTVKADIHTLQDKDMVGIDGVELEVLHVPGHTPGGIALLLKKPQNKILFSGDSLFCLGVGRTDFPGADAELLIKSIKEKLLSLPDDTRVYPGHGPATTIGEEKEGNPFLH